MFSDSPSDASVGWKCLWLALSNGSFSPARWWLCGVKWLGDYGGSLRSAFCGSSVRSMMVKEPGMSRCVFSQPKKQEDHSKWFPFDSKQWQMDTFDLLFVVSCCSWARFDRWRCWMSVKLSVCVRKGENLNRYFFLEVVRTSSKLKKCFPYVEDSIELALKHFSSTQQF